jgi:transcriptional regulator with XRE-family HTH domain
MHERQAGFALLMHSDERLAMCNDPDMTDARDTARARLEQLLSLTGLDATSLAREAGVSHTTVTRFLNDPRHKYVLSHRTLTKLEDAARRLIGSAASQPLRPGTPPSSRLVNDPEQLAVLDLWLSIPRRDRMRVMRMIQAAADDPAETG